MHIVYVLFYVLFSFTAAAAVRRWCFLPWGRTGVSGHGAR